MEDYDTQRGLNIYTTRTTNFLKCLELKDMSLVYGKRLLVVRKSGCHETHRQ